MKNKTNLINYYYNIILDIIKREIHAKKKKKTRIINIYDNKFKKRQIWQSLK